MNEQETGTGSSSAFVLLAAHLLHLLLEGGEDLVALGQSAVALLELVRIERHLAARDNF